MAEHVRKATPFLPGSNSLPLDDPNLTYAERRDFLRDRNKTAAEAHPRAALAGEIAGGLASAAVIPGGAAAGGARTLGQLAKAGARVGAAYGAASGLGSSEADLTHGEVGRALLDTGLGAAGGAVLGAGAEAAIGALKPVAAAARRKLTERFGRVFGSEVLGASKPKDVQAWSNILDRDLDPIKHKGVTQTAEQFLGTPEARAIEHAAHAKKWDRAEELAQDALAAREPARVADYARIDKQAGEFEVGRGLDAIERDARRALNGPKKDGAIAKELELARSHWVHDYSSVPADVLQRRIGQRAGVEGADTAASAALERLGAELPSSGLVTRTEIQKALQQTGEHAEVGRWLDKDVLDPQSGLLTWNPAAKIPSVELRSVVTSAQERANTALGMLNATPNWQKANAVKKAVNRALDEYLEEAAGRSSALRKTVTDIRQRDIELSVLAAAKDGIKSSLAKENVGEYKNLLGKVVRHGTGVLGGAALAAQGAKVPGDIAGGHPIDAAEHASLGLLGAGLLGRSTMNAAARSRLLDKLLAAAEAGNPRAQKLLARYGIALGSEQAGQR